MQNLLIVVEIDIDRDGGLRSPGGLICNMFPVERRQIKICMLDEVSFYSPPLAHLRSLNFTFT